MVASDEMDEELRVLTHRPRIGIRAELLDGRCHGIDQSGSLVGRFVSLIDFQASFYKQYFLAMIASFESWFLDYWPTRTDCFLMGACSSRRISSILRRKVTQS